ARGGPEGAGGGRWAGRRRGAQGPGPPRPPRPRADPARRERWARALRSGPLPPAEGFRLLGDYGIRAARARAAGTAGAALAAAAEIGYPVVLKTAAPGVAHKSDAGGGVLRIPGAAA